MTLNLKMTTNDLIVSHLKDNKYFNLEDIEDSENLPFDLTDKEYEDFPDYLKILNDYTLTQRINVMRKMVFKFFLYNKETDEKISEFESEFKTKNIMEAINKISLEKYNKPFSVDNTTLLLHIKTITRLPTYRKRYTIKTFYLRVEGFPDPVKTDNFDKIKKNFKGPYHVLLKRMNFKLYNAVDNHYFGDIKAITFKQLYLDYIDKTQQTTNNPCKFNNLIKKLITHDDRNYEIIDNIKVIKEFDATI